MLITTLALVQLRTYHAQRCALIMQVHAYEN